MVFSEIPDPFSPAQFVGYVAMMLGIIAFLQKDDVRMKLLVAVMGCVMCAHFIMLDRFMAGFSALLAGSRAGLSVFEWVRLKAHYFSVFYMLVSCILLYLTYQNWVDILAFLAAIIGITAFFYLHGLWLRYVLLLGGMCWFSHNVLAGSYGPAVMEAFIIMANIVTIYRLQVQQKKLPSRKEAQL